MDIKDIRSFIECYETRSINKAAKSLFITPQGLGKSLDRLEQELQIRLFERNKQGLVPTQAGIFFYEKSQAILDNIQELEQGIEDIKKKNNVLRLGYSCGLIRFLSIKKVDILQELLGDTELVLEEASNTDTKEKLVNNKIDVALVIGRIAAKDFKEIEISSKKLCAVVPNWHPLFNKLSITISDLRSEPLICLNEKYQAYTNLINSCEREGFFPNIKIKTMEAAMIYEFVAEGIGVGIDVDIHSRTLKLDEVKLIPIEDAIPWTIYVAYNQSQEKNKAVQRVINELMNN